MLPHCHSNEPSVWSRKPLLRLRGRYKIPLLQESQAVPRTKLLVSRECLTYFLSMVARGFIQLLPTCSFNWPLRILSTVKRGCIPPRRLGPSTRKRRFTQPLNRKPCMLWTRSRV